MDRVLGSEHGKQPKNRCKTIDRGRQCLLVHRHNGAHEYPGSPANPVRSYPVHNKQPGREVVLVPKTD